MFSATAYVIRDARVDDVPELVRLGWSTGDEWPSGQIIVGEIDGIVAAALAIDENRAVTAIRPRAAVRARAHARPRGGHPRPPPHPFGRRPHPRADARDRCRRRVIPPQPVDSTQTAPEPAAGSGAVLIRHRVYPPRRPQRVRGPRRRHGRRHRARLRAGADPSLLRPRSPPERLHAEGEPGELAERVIEGRARRSRASTSRHTRARTRAWEPSTSPRSSTCTRSSAARRSPRR